LALFCQQNKNCYYYFDANLIRAQPHRVFYKLQDWLSLTSPLSEQYQLFSLTGHSRIGDSSKNMSSGHIIKQQSDYYSITLDVNLLQSAINETQVYQQVIIQHAIEALFS
jgi:hypothetical protein